MPLIPAEEAKRKGNINTICKAWFGFSESIRGYQKLSDGHMWLICPCFLLRTDVKNLAVRPAKYVDRVEASLFEDPAVLPKAELLGVVEDKKGTAFALFDDLFLYWVQVCAALRAGGGDFRIQTDYSPAIMFLNVAAEPVALIAAQAPHTVDHLVAEL